MNLHRYKASFSLQSTGDTNFEFSGTWIGFGGMLALIGHISIGVPPNEVSLIATSVISTLFLANWVVKKSLNFTAIYSVLLLCVSLYALQLSTAVFPFCEDIKWARARAECEKETVAIGIYAVYLLSIFGTYFYYITKNIRIRS